MFMIIIIIIVRVMMNDEDDDYVDSHNVHLMYLNFAVDKTLLAQCLLQWLDDPQHNPQAIKWISKKDGLFQIIDSTRISSLWGGKKENKKKMNHEKLSRALRHYYKDGTLEKQSNKKRLCYKFSKSAMQKFNIYFTKQ